VRRLQQLLRGQGMQLPVTGVFGGATASALAAYRIGRGLPGSTTTDDAVWTDLLQRSGSAVTSRTR